MLTPLEGHLLPQKHFPHTSFKSNNVIIVPKISHPTPNAPRNKNDRAVKCPFSFLYTFNALILNKFSSLALSQRKQRFPLLSSVKSTSYLCSRQLILLLRHFTLFSPAISVSVCGLFYVHKWLPEPLFCVRHHAGHRNTLPSVIRHPLRREEK